MFDYTSEDQIPYGYCQCGCGEKAPLAQKNHTATRTIKGQPEKYIRSHVNRRTVNESNRLFWSKVIITANDDLCWIWVAGCDKDGYGKTQRNGKPERSHRIAWAYPDYIIPDDMYVLHSCDNPACCNPKHLFLGTNQENMDDKVSKDRVYRPKGEKNTSAKLTHEQVIEIRQRYAIGGISQSKLGDEYGVTQSSIGFIVRGEHWK